MMRKGSRPPWMLSTFWTKAWIAEPQFIDNTSAVATWSPQKGSLAWTQSNSSNKPTWATNWGHNKGCITFNGSSHYMIADSLASEVTGLQGFTMLVAVEALTVTNSTNLAIVHFGHSTSSNTSLTKSSCSPLYISANPFWSCINSDDASHFSFTTFGSATTGRHVHSSISYPTPSPPTWGADIDAAYVAGALTGATLGTQTLDQATIGAFRGSTVNIYTNCRIRAILFSPNQALAQGTSYYNEVKAAEDYLVREI